MAWAFVRPADPRVLAPRPLLDLGTGDGQTIDALAPDGFVVGVDRTLRLLRPGSVNASVLALPFGDATFQTVLAADLFHHLDDDDLAQTLREAARVLGPGGRLVSWWLEHTPDPSPDAPRHTRTFEAVAERVTGAGLRAAPLALDVASTNSATVGLLGEC